MPVLMLLLKLGVLLVGHEGGERGFELGSPVRLGLNNLVEVADREKESLAGGQKGRARANTHRM